MRTLLLGARAQLGQDILRQWPAGTVTGLSRRQCDVTDRYAVRAAIRDHRPDLVVNVAASHRVDAIEADDTDARNVNAHGAYTVAREADRRRVPVLWISTDYVFDGAKATPYTETDETNPLSRYGRSKRLGEFAVARANPQHYIVRTSGLYGLRAGHGNFVEAVLKQAASGQPLRVVDDQFCAPTSTEDLARVLYALVQTGAYGVTHITNAGGFSWFGFAWQILRGTGAHVEPVTTAEYGAAAKRPKWSVLDNSRLHSLGVESLPPVQDALGRYLKQRVS